MILPVVLACGEQPPAASTDQAAAALRLVCSRLGEPERTACLHSLEQVQRFCQSVPPPRARD
jgi:hypothetical protein